MKLHGCFGDAQWYLWAQQHKSLGPPGRDGPQTRASPQQAGRVAAAPSIALGGHCPYLHPPSTLLGLPPSMLVSSPCAEQPATPSCANFFHLVNSELVGVEQARSGAGLGAMCAPRAGSGESSGVHLWSRGASVLGMGPTCMGSLRWDRPWHLEPQGVLHPIGHRQRDQRPGPVPSLEDDSFTRLVVWAPEVPTDLPASPLGTEARQCPHLALQAPKGARPCLCTVRDGRYCAPAGGFVKMHHVGRLI